MIIFLFASIKMAEFIISVRINYNNANACPLKGLKVEQYKIIFWIFYGDV